MAAAPSILRRCFLRSMTSNRWKSVAACFALAAALFCAHELLAHVSTVPAFSKYFLTVVVPAARGRSLITSGVRLMYLYASAWRATPVMGPSMIAYGTLSDGMLSEGGVLQLLTRLASMISTITASLPSSSLLALLLTRTTRPTSTNRENVVGTLAICVR